MPDLPSPTEQPAAMPDKPLCERCGEVIGAYEPMILLVDGEPRRTSRSAERGSGPQAGERYHAGCYQP